MKFLGACLISKNVPALSKFYSNILRIEGEGDDTHMEFNTEGGGLAIFSVEGMEKMAPNSMDGAGYGSFTITFEVKDVDEEYERVKALGVEFLKLPTTHPWGCRSLWFRDFDRNIVNFVTILNNN